MGRNSIKFIGQPVTRVRAEGGQVINKYNGKPALKVAAPTVLQPVKPVEPEVVEAKTTKGKMPEPKPLPEKYPEGESKATRKQVLEAIQKALSDDENKKKRGQRGGMLGRIE